MLIVGLRGVVHRSSWPARRAIRRCPNCCWSTVPILRCVCLFDKCSDCIHKCVCMHVHACVSNIHMYVYICTSAVYILVFIIYVCHKEHVRV